MNIYTYINFIVIIITWGLNPILTRIGSNLTDPRAYMILFSLINASSLLLPLIMMFGQKYVPEFICLTII